MVVKKLLREETQTGERERKLQGSRDGRFTHVAVVERVASDCCLRVHLLHHFLSLNERRHLSVIGHPVRVEFVVPTSQ